MPRSRMSRCGGAARAPRDSSFPEEAGGRLYLEGRA